MKKAWYCLSIALLFVPFTIGVVGGYVWRGLKSGFYVGFQTLHISLESDLVATVNKLLKRDKPEEEQQQEPDYPEYFDEAEL